MKTMTAASGGAGGSGRPDSADRADMVNGWLVGNLLPGRIIHVGSARRPFPVDDPAFQATAVDRLVPQMSYHEVFDHALVTDVTAEHRNPQTLMTNLFTVLKEGGRLVVALPFGTPEDGSSSVFYFASLRRLVEPLFEIAKLELVDSHVVLVGLRRAEPLGPSVFSLDLDERAFRERERDLRERLRQVRSQVVQSGARYRGLVARSEELRASLQKTNRELAQLRGRVHRLRPLYILPLTAYRRVKQLRASARQGLRRSTTATAFPAASTDPVLAQVPQAAKTVEPTVSWMDILTATFEEWIAAARAAEGDEVVLMFSGTTFIQEERANRPIRLTRVYLERKCPVFFNYYRWSDKDALPAHPDPLVFQSPIDATPKLLDRLITADFAGKKKIFYASFPHEVMVRYLTVASQHGWVTVYDSRDDWEEFAKVGMAKWYHPGYERYVAGQADIVSAVSRPLARKMSALAGGRTVHVSANGLDPKFPRPKGARRTGGTPIIGYFGHLTDKWFDWPLVIAAAERYPEFVFELAGHGAPAALMLPPNVRLLGLMGHQDLAERSLTWSVAIIPFKNSPLADAVDPIKVYEYLHLRLPVLATYFPQCRDYPGTVITEGREEFLELVPKLVGAELPEDEIAAWLADNTWERRVETYSQQADEIRALGRSGLTALLEGTK